MKAEKPQIRERLGFISGGLGLAWRTLSNSTNLWITGEMPDKEFAIKLRGEIEYLGDLYKRLNNYEKDDDGKE